MSASKTDPAARPPHPTELSPIYRPTRPAQSRDVMLRGVRHHLREWGARGAPQLFLLHGWMDASASWQFMVDALAGDFHVLALDWRGFGRSAWCGDAYWFPDYLADLDALLALESPEQPATLVGHSMGGNVSKIYAGVRPERVARLVLVDAFGLADRKPEEAPNRYASWLAQVAAPAELRGYSSLADLAKRMMHDNPRLNVARANWLAAELSVEVAGSDGRALFRLGHDPAHKRVNAVLYRRAEVEACCRQVRAPVLWVEPADASLRRNVGVSDDDLQRLLGCFADLHRASIPDAGHNLHHDQPEALARVLEDFLHATPDGQGA